MKRKSAIIISTLSVALSWAESITNSDLRSRTMISVVESWAATDPHAAML